LSQIEIGVIIIVELGNYKLRAPATNWSTIFAVLCKKGKGNDDKKFSSISLSL